MKGLLSNFRSAFRSLLEQRQRSLLSATGIMVGSAAIVLLISIAKGVQADIGQQVTGLGVNLLVVLPARVTDESLFAPNIAGVSYLGDADVDRVRQVSGVVRATPLMFVGGGIQYKGKESPTTFIIAAGPEWFQIHPSKLAEGSFYSDANDTTPVCVIGSIAKDNLFGKESAVGKKIDVNGKAYTVIGITEDKKSEESLFSMGGFENIAYIPYRHAKTVIPNPQVNRIMIQTAPDREPESLVTAVENTLLQRLSRQKFSVLTQKDLLKLVYKIMGILTSLLTGLTSVALAVGGLGIMTVMLMAVNERAREIGIRKAFGATRADIFSQFLFEAVLLTILGGILGLTLSYSACVVIAATTKIKPLVTVSTVALGFWVSLLVGTVFGVLPAMRASGKNPVDSLRHE